MGSLCQKGLSWVSLPHNPLTCYTWNPKPQIATLNPKKQPFEAGFLGFFLNQFCDVAEVEIILINSALKINLQHSEINSEINSY
jgi:hypothetical protein